VEQRLSRIEHERADDLGQLIKQGTKLGEVVDIYSYEVLEEMTAPVDGYLFFSRYSGVVGAGTQAFALAEEAASRWLELGSPPDFFKRNYRVPAEPKSNYTRISTAC